MRVLSVVGARPNFIKLAPVARALGRRSMVVHEVVHTGQHYDELMSEAFFEELDIPRPIDNLGVGSGTHAQQTASVLAGCERVCLDRKPDWLLVYGDVNSTVGAALAAVKLGVRVGHVEAGLRSYDRTMPEEHNRVVTDHLADIAFAPSRDAVANLRLEGIPMERIAFVGNVMIDTLVLALPAARAARVLERLELPRRGFALATLHRPSNVDSPETLREVIDALAMVAEHIPVVFPVHPRTRERIGQADLTSAVRNLHLISPLPYIEMLSLTDGARVVITDSGGLQEETTYLGVPCVTVRPNTERPVTVTNGTNRLVPLSRNAIVTAALNGGARSTITSIERWDGNAGERIAAVLCDGQRFD